MNVRSAIASELNIHFVEFDFMPKSTWRLDLTLCPIRLCRQCERDLMLHRDVILYLDDVTSDIHAARRIIS